MNEQDLTELPAEVRSQMTFVPARTLEDVIKTTVYVVQGQDVDRALDAYRRFFAANTRGGWLPAGLTLDQFKETLRTGKDQKNRHPLISPLLQVMPWPVYGKMSDKDLEAVYEYLRAIPCIGSPARCGS